MGYSQQEVFDTMDELYRTWNIDSNTRFIGKLAINQDGYFCINDVRIPGVDTGLYYPNNMDQFQRAGKKVESIRIEHKERLNVESGRFKEGAVLEFNLVPRLGRSNYSSKDFVFLNADHLKILTEEQVQQLNNKVIGIEKANEILREINEKIENRKSEAEYWDKKQNDYERLKEDVEELKGEKENLKSEVEKKKREVDALRKIGFLPSDEMTEIKNNNDLDSSYLQVNSKNQWKAELSRIEGYLSKNHAIYSRNLVKVFTALLQTQDMIVLAGRSGSGKTSFCRLYGDAVGAEVTIVPVKPNWMSTEDLLGYFNPASQTYVPTAFYDAIKNAASHPEKLHLIVLDEMNIAKPEYYFADFLSCMENRGSREITLSISGKKGGEDSVEDSSLLKSELTAVSKVIASFIEEREEFSLYNLLDDKFYRELLLENLTHCGQDSRLLEKIISIAKESATVQANKRYDLSITDNIRFIGTINVDETTHFFSPKVLDRVHVLKVDAPRLVNKNGVLKLEAEDICTGTGEKKNISALSFGQRQQYEELDLSNPLLKNLHSLQDVSRNLGIDLSFRVMRQALTYQAAMQSLDVNFDGNEVVDTIIRTKLMPRMVFDAASNMSGGGKGSKTEAMKQFVRILENIDVSEDCKQEAKALLQQAENGDNQVNYWAL